VHCAGKHGEERKTQTTGYIYEDKLCVWRKSKLGFAHKAHDCVLSAKSNGETRKKPFCGENLHCILHLKHMTMSAKHNVEIDGDMPQNSS